MANVIYDNISDALAAIKVSYELIEEQDSLKVKVCAPMYKNKEYILNKWYSKDYPKDKLHTEIRVTLANRYDIYPITGYAIF